MEIPDFTLYTIEDLESLVLAAKAALAGRKIIDTAEAKIDAILTDVKKAQGRTDGDDWVQPTGAHDAYPLGARVARGGKVWENLTTANVWEPGVSGWREYVEPGSLAGWVQPTGAHDMYVLGDRVLHNGKVWESTNAANVWEPGTVGTEALWIEVAQ